MVRHVHVNVILSVFLNYFLTESDNLYFFYHWHNPCHLQHEFETFELKLNYYKNE
ncbi:hypothetical protein IP98_00416 [Flavobacterium cauense R2A-7]|uniref:Uncharacterized protein n=1 Tax=Flavobacterium cauense R2A-7 TaxID=1341154 RepID=A0A562M6A8_9FLAO|nr:hypothetical protein IP98_00416 [Flavobacterium cauense R2A-7]